MDGAAMVPKHPSPLYPAVGMGPPRHAYSKRYKDSPCSEPRNLNLEYIPPTPFGISSLVLGQLLSPVLVPRRMGAR